VADAPLGIRCPGGTLTPFTMCLVVVVGAASCCIVCRVVPASMPFEGCMAVPTPPNMCICSFNVVSG
jgi:hypothetical protein